MKNIDNFDGGIASIRFEACTRLGDNLYFAAYDYNVSGLSVCHRFADRKL